MKRALLAACLTVSLVAVTSFAAAQDENEGEDDTAFRPIIKKVDGHNFRVPADMPMTKSGGVVRPIEYDEYSAMKYSQVMERLAKIENSIDELKDDLSSVKEAVKRLEQRALTSK